MGKRVLLIEDEPNIIEAIRFILSRDGWTVETHSDGGTAVAAVEAKRPDIIILDVMLPNKSGFEILRELRGMDDHKTRPILMLTARGQKKDRELAEASGVSVFMTKPFSNADMLDAVRTLAADAQGQAVEAIEHGAIRHGDA
ncbi:response regulator transcription factor [Celeribacter marinus]|uniref:response regulator transcription factor n=1 Tax=Celeribacter marinus TaxID=1397108 RepID=UPI003F6BDA08